MQTVWQATFQSDKPNQPWQWKSGLPIVANAAAVRDAMAVLENVIAALNAHNATEVARLFQVYIEENALANDFTPEDLREQLAGWVEAWTSAPRKPLVPSDYNLSIEGEQQLLHLTRKDGLSVFTADAKIRVEGISEVYLANLPLGWSIVC